jgi:hypothetical protein
MLQTKALYNLLRMNSKEDPNFKADAWAIEDLRVLPIEELFSKLLKYQVQLDRKAFVSFAEQCDTPEDLADLLLPDAALEEERDPFYLIVFELWRRLVPEKQSLSIFGDELDHRITLYEEESLDNDELIQDALANLLEILDENVDAGADPEQILSAVSDYCAHDLENFLYEYIRELLDTGNSLYASELMDGFSVYATEPIWFDFLRIRILALTDIGEANKAMEKLLKNEIELSLLLDILQFLSANGDHALFKLGIKKAILLLESQEDLREVVRLTADFYNRLDEEAKEKEAQKLLLQQKKGPIQPSDLKILQELISKDL